jgi:hypothetical protein
MGSLPATDLETSMSLNQPMKADAHYFVKQISGEGWATWEASFSSFPFFMA